ncbi:hypothetical protein [Haloechinothrix halophila]|uniref:hypothetical protein n=1 Tax=Haloechinothrix halophila TaxID=1069073 RepID=UPI00040BBDCA|nr:hypothetical protein [Haloechinothrix halophila]
MPDFTVDIGGLDALGKNLDRTNENLDHATKRLADLGPDSIGPDILDEACAGFRDDWEEGVDKLREAVAVYAALCVCRSEANPATLSAAQFAIFVKNIKLSGERPLAAVAGGLRKPGEPRETAFVRFPSGDGLVVGEEVRGDSPLPSQAEPHEIRTPYGRHK